VGGNPKTGAPLPLPGHRVVVFPPTRRFLKEGRIVLRERRRAIPGNRTFSVAVLPARMTTVCRQTPLDLSGPIRGPKSPLRSWALDASLLSLASPPCCRMETKCLFFHFHSSTFPIPDPQVISNSKRRPQQDKQRRSLAGTMIASIQADPERIAGNPKRSGRSGQEIPGRFRLFCPTEKIGAKE